MECHSEGSLSPKCRDESIRQTLDFHLHIDVMWQRKDFQCLNKFWYFYDVRRYTCLTALVVVYISAPRPSGLDALDPSLPPSNNSQNVVEENSTTQCHLKDGAIWSVDLPPTNLLIYQFHCIYSVRQYSRVWRIQRQKKYSGRRAKLFSPITSTLLQNKWEYSKGADGICLPIHALEWESYVSRHPPQHYPKQHPTDCFDTLKYIQSMMKSETWHPQNSPL